MGVTQCCEVDGHQVIVYDTGNVITDGAALRLCDASQQIGLGYRHSGSNEVAFTLTPAATAAIY